MKNLIIFNASDPLGTAKRVSAQDIVATHGSTTARDIMDGADITHKALYAGIFIGKLRALLEDLDT